MKRRSAWILGLGLVAAAPAASALFGTEFSALSSAWAAEDVAFDNLSFNIGSGTVSIPHVMVTGSSLSKGDLQGLFSNPWSLSTADTLAKFDAASVAVPELHVEIAGATGDNAPPMKASVTYRDVHFVGIKGGKVAQIGSAGVTEEISSPVPISISAGAFAATDYDLVGVVRFLFGTAAPDDAPKPVTGGATIDGFKVKGPEGVEVSIGRMAAGAFKLRPLSTPAWGFVSSMMAMSAAHPDGQLPPEEAAKMLGFMADFYDAFAVDGMTVSDISFKVPDPSFQSASLKTVKLGPIANSRFAEMGIEGLDVNAGGGHAKLGRIAILGMDLKPFLSTLAQLAKKGDLGGDAMNDVDWHTAIPRLDGFVLNGVDLLIPEGTPPKALKLAGYELKLSNYVGGIPTSIRNEVNNFIADASIFEDNAEKLIELGYDSLDLSSTADLAWNEGAKSIRVNELSAKGVKMGSLSLKGAFGNVPRELFAGSTAQMQVAALGVTLSEASLRLENGGLIDKLIEQTAKEQGTTSDALRAQMGSQAALGIPQLLGGSDKAKAFANAVASFIANPKTLTISVKSKDAGGLGLTDLMGGNGPDPVAIFEKLDVTASANN